MILSFSRRKRKVSAPSTKAEKVSDAKNERNDVPWLRCATSGEAIIDEVKLKSERGLIIDMLSAYMT